MMSVCHLTLIWSGTNVLDLGIWFRCPLSCHNSLPTPFVPQPYRNVFSFPWVAIHNLWFHTLAALNQIYFPEYVTAFLIDNSCLGKSSFLNQSLTPGLGPVLFSLYITGRNFRSPVKLQFCWIKEWLTTSFLL